FQCLVTSSLLIAPIKGREKRAINILKCADRFPGLLSGHYSYSREDEQVSGNLAYVCRVRSLGTGPAWLHAGRSEGAGELAGDAPVAAAGVIAAGICEPVLPEDGVLAADGDCSHAVVKIIRGVAGCGGAGWIAGTAHRTFVDAADPEHKGCSGDKVIAAQVSVPEARTYVEARPDLMGSDGEQFVQEAVNHRLILRDIRAPASKALLNIAEHRIATHVAGADKRTVPGGPGGLRLDNAPTIGRAIAGIQGRSLHAPVAKGMGIPNLAGHSGIEGIVIGIGIDAIAHATNIEMERH